MIQAYMVRNNQSGRTLSISATNAPTAARQAGWRPGLCTVRRSEDLPDPRPPDVAARSQALLAGKEPKTMTNQTAKTPETAKLPKLAGSAVPNGTGTEAPASFTVRGFRNGFECRFTIRDENPKELARRSVALTDWLTEANFEPFPSRPPAQAANGSLATATPEDPSWCKIHNSIMTRRERDGQHWWSHKAPDGTWCKGKAANGNARQP